MTLPVIKRFLFCNKEWKHKIYRKETYEEGLYHHIRTVRNYNNGCYSSSISKLFNHINSKVKNEEKKQGNTNSATSEGETEGSANYEHFYRQYETIIKELNYNKLLGRDLSYCMNILSKIKYFSRHSFWENCCNRLCKGYMVHRINVSSFFLIANSLGKLPLLHNTLEDKKGKNNYIGSFLFHSVLYDSNSGKFEIKKNINFTYHNIYNEIAIRFLLDVSHMDLDSVSCVLNSFSRLGLVEYNIIGYYFADYFVFVHERFKQMNKLPLKEQNTLSTDRMFFDSCRDLYRHKRKKNFEVNGQNVSKLALIVHSLSKLNIIHPEFYFVCANYFKIYGIHLNNIDVCSILYSYGKHHALYENYRNDISLKRLRNPIFESYVDDIIKYTKTYHKYYVKENDIRGDFEKVYLFYVKDDFHICDDICEEKKYKKKCVDMIRNIAKQLTSEHILNSLSAMQLSSISLSLCKLKINVFEIFDAFNYKAHYLWKHFSLYSIADFLYAMNEKNIYDEQVSLLLFYQFCKNIYKKWNDALKKNPHLRDTIKRKLSCSVPRKKKYVFLDEKDLSLVVRAFQSLSKGDLMSVFFDVDIKNEHSFPYKLHYDYIESFEDRKKDIKEITERKGVKLRYATTSTCYKDKEYSRQNFRGDDRLTSSQNTEMKSERKQDMWENFEQYPDNSLPIFHIFNTDMPILKLHILKNFYFCINEHWEMLSFDSKCFLCYFSVTIPHYVYPLTSRNNINNHMKNTKKPPFLSTKIVKGRLLNVTLSSKLLFHILETMSVELLNESYVRQIYTCFLCLYVNIITIFQRYLIDTMDAGNICAMSPERNTIPKSGKKQLEWGKVDCYASNEKASETTRKDIKKNEYILHLFSLKVLKKIKLFLDFATTVNYQQHEMNLTSKIHNEVYNSLRVLINYWDAKNERNRIQCIPEMVVGPFVLDFVILGITTE